MLIVTHVLYFACVILYIAACVRLVYVYHLTFILLHFIHLFSFMAASQ